MRRLFELLHFVALIFSYFFSKIISFLTHGRLKPKVLGQPRTLGSISKIDIIDLSYRNLVAKKNRTLITIGGITIGIAIIVFLVSLGFGTQKLVVGRVARLEEMSQADVSLSSGSNLKITDETLNSFKGIPHLKSALPLISVVGHVNYNNSVSDMAVYGVTSDFLSQSAIKPVAGKIFISNTLISALPQSAKNDSNSETINSLISDESTDSASLSSEIEYTIKNDTWVKVRQSPDSKSKIIGYTKNIDKSSVGLQISGQKFTDFDGATSDQWIKTQIPLWVSKSCDISQPDCEEGKYSVLRDTDNSQVQQIGYIALISDITVSAIKSDIKTPDSATISLSSEALKQAVVNRTFLKVLNIKENEAVGKKFTASFVVVGDLLSDSETNVQSSPVEYEIIGVIPDEKTPVFYVPFIDLRSLGINNYSQVKIEVDSSNNLSAVRRQIEAMGYGTRSVSDTVSQINSLFATLRTVLALLGLMALSVAALGMFNTLTVSLMERTREVGLMKTMGMKSYEIKDLFMAESLIMGLCGGVFGLTVGFLMGKLLSLILSLFSLFKGLGFIDVSSIPLVFTLIILLLSLLIGILTGIYPARRATKISALNALRYE